MGGASSPTDRCFMVHGNSSPDRSFWILNIWCHHLHCGHNGSTRIMAGPYHNASDLFIPSLPLREPFSTHSVTRVCSLVIRRRNWGGLDSRTLGPPGWSGSIVDTMMILMKLTTNLGCPIHSAIVNSVCAFFTCWSMSYGGDITVLTYSWRSSQWGSWREH